MTLIRYNTKLNKLAKDYKFCCHVSSSRSIVRTGGLIGSLSFFEQVVEAAVDIQNSRIAVNIPNREDRAEFLKVTTEASIARLHLKYDTFNTTISRISRAPKEWFKEVKDIFKGL
jgi:hypothetical protein